MITKVQKWGNSLALRIPKAFADTAKIENDSVVDVSFVDGQIVIKPIIPEKMTLEQLLSGVTENNIHREINTGDAVGSEAW
ncbi:MAG: AbrB/MazE/SpoVT family DNA-binding domain-containing protein [Sulfurimonas sp.]|nr:AbrB/MazE/SpoVT family DNA-binding domain-containing protein [Sulfurimonas sp.]